MTRIRNEIGINHIEEASFDKGGNVRVPVSGQPGFPSRLWRPWAEEGHQLLSNCFRWPSPVPSPKKFLDATKCASDCTAASGFYDFPGVIEFFVKKVTSHVRKPVKVCLPANIFFLQVSPCKIIENLFPYGFGFSKDHGISVFQGLVRQSRHMESTQYHLRSFKPQKMGDVINVRYMVGQSNN